MLLGIYFSVNHELTPLFEEHRSHYSFGNVHKPFEYLLKSFRLDFSYQHPDPDVGRSTAALSDWFQRLDLELEQAIATLSEDDIQNRFVDRGRDFRIRPNINLMIYQEALLIFYGKVSVYLKVLGKTPSEQWQHWIA